MALNYIWIAFFLIAFIVALVKLIFLGDTEIFGSLFKSIIDNSKLGFEISLFLTGILAFWLGMMKIGEKGGMVRYLSIITRPLFAKLFPTVPKDHPATGHMLFNICANMLGLDNAATPIGLKAMEGLQELNDEKDTASDAMIMFLVLNTSGLTLIPISIMVYRAERGAANPADIFIPILIATFFSTMVGLIAVSIKQKINLWNKTVMAYLGTLTLFIVGLIAYINTLTQEEIQVFSNVASNLVLVTIIMLFILLGVKNKINIYESFIEGAKDGFKTAVTIIPYLIAILVAIGVFRTSGAMDFIIDGISYVVAAMGIDTSFVPALPTAFMKPLSGSGARGMMLETMTTYGADSFAGRMASVMQGSTETTFYIIAVYFGSVNIKKIRYAVQYGLIADLAGLVAAIFICYQFFPR